MTGALGRRLATIVSAGLACGLAGCGAAPAPATASPPPDVEARFDAALDLVSRGSYDRALASIEPLIVGAEAHPKRDAVLFLAAECRYHRAEFADAAGLYRELAERYPDSRYARVVPARLLAIGIELLERPPATLLEAIAPDRRAAIDAIGRAAVDDPRGGVADDAFLRLADAHLAEGRPDLAVRALERLIAEHPDSTLCEEAWYRLAEAEHAATRGAGYDAAPLVEARAAAMRYLERYGPGGRFSIEAATRIREVTAELVAHEERIAAYYAARGNTRGEELHRNNARRLAGKAPDGASSIDLLRPRPNPADLLPPVTSPAVAAPEGAPK